MAAILVEQEADIILLHLQTMTQEMAGLFWTVVLVGHKLEEVALVVVVEAEETAAGAAGLHWWCRKRR